MIGFFGSLEIETGMGEEEVSYVGFQFANSRDFVFLFWRKEKRWIFILEEGEKKRWRKEKGLHFVCQRWRSGIWGAGLAFDIAS